MAFNHKHLIDITEYSEEDIKLILETAKAFSEVNERAIKKVPTLKGKTIVNMFNEPSTRTRSSFELAEKRLSADSLNFGGSSTSTVKGESLVDTVETLNAYKIDCIVVRDAGHRSIDGGLVHDDRLGGSRAHRSPSSHVLTADTVKKIDARPLKADQTPTGRAALWQLCNSMWVSRTPLMVKG